uniref:KIB1-4 beta-propeller domain-containing protein n=1 Tax=Oryza punctata TaxID=4537 RepID=A0A0E0JZ17_ORYPU
MADANMAWAEFPEECVAGILSHLPCLLDHAMFSGVCKPWRTIALQHPPRQIPLLLMPSRAATSFFCVASGDTHHRPGLPADARGARFFGSFPGGWLAGELPESLGYTLLNLCTGARVALPTRLRCSVNARGSNKYPIIIHAVTLSAAPSEDRPYYAAAVMSSQSNIAFWRPGMGYWTPPTENWGAELEDWQKLTFNGPIEDVTYYIGPLGEGFYVLTNKEDLLLYTPNTNNNPGELTMSSVEGYSIRRNPRPTMPDPGEVLARYLVQSRGELLMVVRFVSAEKATVAFDVFKLELQPRSWKKFTFDTLTGRRFFLGRGCSVAVDMENPCPLYIYFLDDSARFHGPGTSHSQQVENPFPSADTGRSCWFFDQGIVYSLPRGPPSDCSPWTWFFLSDETFRLVPPAAAGGVVSDSSDESNSDDESIGTAHGNDETSLF